MPENFYKFQVRDSIKIRLGDDDHMAVQDAMRSFVCMAAEPDAYHRWMLMELYDTYPWITHVVTWTDHAATNAEDAIRRWMTTASIQHYLQLKRASQQTSF